MTSPKTALLLVGSAKPAGQSTSEALGSYLVQKLAEHGVAVTTMHVARALRTEGRVAELLQAIDRSDLLILAFPLYVDSPPYLVAAALERIAAHRQTQPAPKPPSFLVIVNCGFPEAHHNRTALAICEQFAVAAGLRWAGGLALGAGGAISGRPLAEVSGMSRNVLAALDLTATALAVGDPAPAEAVALMARPLLPARAYMLMGDLGWMAQARRYRMLTRLGARPFKQDQR
jgi:hypothetical protein